MSGQLQLFWAGSEPVPEPVSPKETTEVEHTGSDTEKPVPNRSRASSCDHNRFFGSPFRGEEPKNRSPQTSPPTERESEPLTLSPSPVTGGRAEVPVRIGDSPVSGAGTDRKPIAKRPSLRPYQLDAITGVERELEAHRSTLLVLPTGCGKTVVFAELASRWVAAGERTLVLAHRTELLDQAAKKLADVGVTTSIDQGQRIGSRWADVVIGSVQTLQRQRLARYPRDFFRKIIVDEAHHAPAKSYGNVLEHFADAKVLGVTATPDRGDGRALGKSFETLAFTYEMRKAIAEGFLSPLRAKRILVEDLDLSGVKTRAGDFDQGELSKLLNDEHALHGVVNPLVEMAGDRQTLVFGVDVAHARAIAETINQVRPGKAIALDGTAKPEERAAVLALFRRGAFQYLCNCALFTEGFDEPGISCVALARPTQSRALYTQMLGRGTRLAPGKNDCLVLDFVGNSGKHRLIGPADALAGRELDDKTRDILEKNLDGQMELEDVLAAAEEEAKKRVRSVSLAALTHYREREVDLFIGDLMPPWDPDSKAAKMPATPEQLARIIELKLGVPPHGISKAEAEAMIEGVAARRSAGLCSIPQARLLERCGFNSRGITFARAGVLISQLKARNAWRTPWLLGAPEFSARRRS